MKRLSPSPQFRAAASTESAAMSPRPSHRGGRYQWSRGFSDRHPGDDGNGQFVTGDSHFQSVRDANRGFRPTEGRNFANHRSFRPQYNQRPPFNSLPPLNSQPLYNPPPHSNASPSLYPPQPFNSQPSLGPSQPFNSQPSFGPSPPFYQNQQFHRPHQQFWPRPPRLQFHRNWEFSNSGMAPECERFTVLSYNLLADYLATSHRNKLYFHIPRYMLDWEWRKRSIIFELGLWSSDILCFQEVDRFQDLEEELKLQGYSGIWKMRTGDPIDGCAIFWHVSRFKLLHEEHIEFKKLGLRDNVAQICVLESLKQNSGKSTSDMAPLPICPESSNKVVVCNIHVLYNPKRGEIKLGQIRILLEKAQAVSKLWDDASVVICGDFNCTPKSPLYNYISEQKLNVADLPRDKLSGQASAEIRPPRQFNSSFRPQSADDSMGAAPTTVDHMKVRHGPNSVGRNLDAADGCKDEILSTVSIPGTVFKENPSGSQNKVQVSAEAILIDSHHEDVYSNLVEKEHGANICANSYSGCDSSATISAQNFMENERPSQVETSLAKDHDASNLSQQHANCSTCTTILDPASVAASFPDAASSELPNETLVPCMKVYALTSSEENPSSISFASEKSNPSPSSVVRILHESEDNLQLESKMENLSIDGPVLVMNEVDDTEEERAKFLSELHDNDGGFPHDLDSSIRFAVLAETDNSFVDDDFLGMESEPTDAIKVPYDPSAWTPMEIEIATGNAECTLVEHPLKLRSTYTEVEDRFGTRDSNGEPVATSYNRCFLGTVDYIWRSQGLQTVRVLAPIPKHVMQPYEGFPTKKWGSDHIALVSELAFTKDENTRSTQTS